MAINISECDDFRFGKNCGRQCGHCYNNSSCHHINGTCVDGCDRGYQGTECMQRKHRLCLYYFNVQTLTTKFHGRVIILLRYKRNLLYPSSSQHIL